MKTAQAPVLFFALAVALLLAVACGSDYEQPYQEEEGADLVPDPEPEPAAMTEPQRHFEAGGLTVHALLDSPEFPGAGLALVSPEGDSTIAAGSVPFDFEVTGYDLGVQTSDAATKGIANSADGQHIHLILNNDPYSAHYEADFAKDLAPGHYVALAFLSRSYHESVKSPGAGLVTQFTVGDGDHEPADLSAPHLFYSRPKGTYAGADTEKLMLDFYLVNTELAPDGNKVRATINGNEFVFSEWIPYVIEGLPMGEVEITLELIDAGGAPVPGPFNSVTRTVTLEPATDS